MPRFAANLSTLFTEVPFLDRYARAAEAGFTAVECQFPYDHSPAELRATLHANGLQQVLVNAPPGDWASGERGLACLPERVQAFHDSILRALDTAAAIECPLVHCMAGIAPPDASPALLAARYAENLAWASEQAAQAGIRIVIEAINPFDMPGYFLATQSQAVAAIEAVGSPALGLQFDVYHCERTEGDAAERLEPLMPLIAHVQIADVPGRHEPGTGRIPWRDLFAQLDQLRYAGWVGCEYTPAGSTEAGFGWLSELSGQSGRR
jgi:hydroxypyruvate isomerase